MITVTNISATAKKFGVVYEAWMQPLCKILDLPFTAVCILVYFANNPNKNTAHQFCECRGYKRALVSVYIERLVQRGYLERVAIKGDRRKMGLVCTKKAEPFIEQARDYQRRFEEALIAGISKEDLKRIEVCFGIMQNNLNAMNKDNAVTTAE